MNEIQVSAFWSKVSISGNKRDCWEWRGARKKAGYGNLRVNKEYKLAHRVAFELANGPIPEGYFVCHVCDNPPCCNPGHLMLGTSRSNAVDMLIKNRQKKPESAARGIVNGNSKLNEADVLEIRRAYASREMTQYQLAEVFGVTQPAIGSIVRNETWRHLL